MKEPTRIPLNPETPVHKDVRKIPMPYKAEWDVAGQDNDDVYTSIDLDKDNTLSIIKNENNSQNN
jgi:hypothetical protein